MVGVRANRLSIRVTADPLDPDEAVASVADPAPAGACVFPGRCATAPEAGSVTGLTYEAWEEIALARLEELGEEMFDLAAPQGGAVAPDR